MIPDDGSVTDIKVANNAAIKATKLSYQDPGTNSVARTVQDKLADVQTDADFASFADAAAATANRELRVRPGIHVITQNITITSTLSFPEGAILQPASGILITLRKMPIAGPYQIFDQSAGGAVQFAGIGTIEVYAEWWGAKGDGSKTDNEVPFQQAADAVQCYFTSPPFTPAQNGDNCGGVVKLAYAGQYLVSGNVTVRTRVVFRGQGGFTEIKANAATWSGSTMFTFQNGTIAQFFCRLEMLRLDANDIDAIRRVIYAPAWQESCGLRDVVIINHRYVAVYIDEGYGGSVGCVLRDVQIFASSNAVDPYGIYADLSVYIVGWYNLVLDGVSMFCGSDTGSKGYCVYANGRIRVDVRHTHVGYTAHGICLDGVACLVGTTLGADHHTTNLVDYTTTWSGYIELFAARKGLASNLLRRTDGAWTLHRDFDPIFGRLHYPHNANDVHAYCYISNGTATPALNDAKGFSSVTKISTGLYEIVFDSTRFSASAGTSYKAKARAESVAGRTWYIDTATATKIRVQFKNLAGAAADCGDFYVEITGNPGA
ncbi:MAG: hypothetical protein J7639_32700 [Paenibacillaceae bacterium]|nr:hypothetical protein [Paenibacillaceae bacterium]